LEPLKLGFITDALSLHEFKVRLITDRQNFYRRFSRAGWGLGYDLLNRRRKTHHASLW